MNRLHNKSGATCLLPINACYATAYLDQFAVFDFASQNLEEGGFPRARGPQHETHAPLRPIPTALACCHENNEHTDYNGVQMWELKHTTACQAL